MTKSIKKMISLLSVCALATAVSATLPVANAKADSGLSKTEVTDALKNELRKYTSADDFGISTWVGFYNSDIKSTRDQLKALEEAGHTFVLNTDFQMTDMRKKGGFVSNDHEFWDTLDAYANELNMNYLYRLAYDRGTETFEQDLQKSLSLSERCIGYQMGDEPPAAVMPMVSTQARKISEAQTGRKDRLFVNLYPSYAGSVNLGGSYEDYVSGYVEGVGAENISYLSFDHYPFRQGSDSSTYFSDMETVRKVAYENGKLRTLAMPQTCTWGNMRETTREEERWNVYSYLAYGVKALSSFCWVCPGDSDDSGEGFREGIVYRDGTIRNQEKYDFQSNLNWEARSIGKVLMNLDTEHAYHTVNNVPGVEILPTNYIIKPVDSSADFIVSYMRQKSEAAGGDHIMLFNKSYTAEKSVNFEISKYSGITGVEYYNPYSMEYEPVDISSGVLSDTFKPGEGKLYRLKGNVNTDLSVEAPTFTKQSGYYTSGVITEILSTDPQAQVYYTTDGSYPTKDSLLYAAGEKLRLGADGASSYLVRAIAYKNGSYSELAQAQYFVVGSRVPSDTIDPSSWEVTGGGTWSVSGGVYKQTQESGNWDTSYTYTGATYSDFLIETDIKIQQTKSGFVGLGLRKTRVGATQNCFMEGFYIAFDDNDHIFIYPGAGGTQVVIKDSPSTVKNQNVVKLSVLCYKQNIFISIDDQPIISYSNVDYELGSGYIALHSGTMATEFSNLRIVDLTKGDFNLGEMQETVVSANYQSEFSVDKYTRKSAVLAALPKTVELVDSNGYKVNANVTWTCDEYDPAKEGPYFFQGAVEIPDTQITLKSGKEVPKYLNLYEISPKLVVFVNYDNDYTEINRLIALVDSLEQEQFSAESWEFMYTRYLAAKDLAADKSQAQSAVDVGMNQLLESINALVRLGVNKNVLNVQIERAQAVTDIGYTTKSYTAFQEAFAKAQEVANAGISTQDEIDEAAVDLIYAREGLQKRGDKTALQSAITNAEGVSTSGKTQESVLKLESEIANAKNLLDGNDFSEAEVTAAINALNEAAEGLVEKPTQPEKGCNSALPSAWSVGLAGLVCAGMILIIVMPKNKKKSK